MRQFSEIFSRIVDKSVHAARVGSTSFRQLQRAKRRTTRQSTTPLATETLEVRQLLTATPIAGLSDEFADAATTDQWQRLNEVEGWNADQLNIYDIDATQSGRMVQEPHTAVWYQNWRGPMAFQNVTGDFSFTTEVHIADRDDIGGSDLDDVPGDGQFSLAGAMIRTPRDITNPTNDWSPGSMADDGTNNGENYVFLSAGYGNGGNEFSLEVKTTRNSNSQLELTPLGQDANTVSVQISRIGTNIIAMYQLPGEDWQVHRRYSRPDMPATLQVGLVSYTDWTKASDFDPFTQNSTVLVPGVAGDPTPAEAFNPDITAGFEYARYVRPDVPDALAEADLTDPNTVSDAVLLSFLGENTNIVDDGTIADPPVDDPPAENPDAPEMAVGMNLVNLTDWSRAWVFRDAFKMARQWASRQLNTTTYDQPYGGELALDENGWVTRLETSVNENGETIQQRAQSYLFSQGGSPAGTYRAEWSGEGVITFGAYVIEQGTTEDGRSFALLDVARDQQLIITITETNPDDYIREIQIFMPDHDGQSLEMENWRAGDVESPFHPLFLERLDPFDTIRFMQWQEVNQDSRDVVTVSDMRPVDYATQATAGTFAPQLGVSVEYQVQLVNELDANGYFNTPHQADDGYVRAFAEYVRDNIHDDAQVFVEYSNEVWNWAYGFEANAWIGQQMELPENEGLTFLDVWAQEARRDFGIWSEVFSGQEDRLTRVAAGQQGNVWLTGQLLERMNGEFDAVSSTSYSGLEGEFFDWVDETTTVDDIIDRVLEVSVPWSLTTQAAHVALADQYTEELGREIDFVTYEGGSHLSAFGTPYAELVQSASEAPRFRDVYEALLNGMEGIGVDMHTQYVFTGTGEPSPWGEFGLLHEMDTRLEEAHEYNALVDFINGDLEAPTVAVSIAVTDAVAHETGDTATFTVTRSDVLAAGDLTVDYEVSGTAANGSDYAELSGSVVIPAGETSAVIIVTPLLDSVISGDEGPESIVLTLVDGDGYEADSASAAATLIDNVTLTISDQSMSHAQDVLQISLPSEVGGQPATHSVNVIGNVAADLNADHNLYVFLADFGFNWGGQQERWLRGDAGYYFILPNGEFSQWQGGFNSSLLLGTLDTIYYDDPALITNAEPSPVQIAIADNVLTIDPAADFVGDFDVELTTTVSGMASTQTFNVEVTNQAPTVSPLNDIAMSAASTQIVDLMIEDLDGDALTITASVLGSVASQLVDEFGLYGEAGNNDWGFNWGGQQERWVRGDGQAWFFLLPNGSVNRWQGSFANSEQVGVVSTNLYDNPQLLLDGQDAGIEVAVVNGQLEVTSAMQTGTFTVTVEVTDLLATTATAFEVTVTNQAPELDLGNIDLAAGETIAINLPTVDADGHAVSYDVEVVDPNLPQLGIEFVDQGSFYTNYLGNNERWLRDVTGQWYFILEDGDFYRWDGSFAASERLAELGTSYYEDPGAILNPPTPAVTATVENGVLTLTATDSFTGSLQLRIRATDGINTVERTVLIESTLGLASAVDDVFVSWGQLV